MDTLKKLIDECKRFKEKELTKEPKEIYRDFYKIHFYEEFKNLFSHYDVLEKDSYEYYQKERIIELVGDMSMSELYGEFLSIDGSIIGNWEDLIDFLELMNEEMAWYDNQD